MGNIHKIIVLLEIFRYFQAEGIFPIGIFANKMKYDRLGKERFEVFCP
jgi:hypothetical protein